MGRIIMYMTAEQIKEWESAMMVGAPKDLPKLAEPKQAISNTFKTPLPSDYNELFEKWFKTNSGVVEKRLIYNHQNREYKILRKL